jgi:hypothetical protein
MGDTTRPCQGPVQPAVGVNRLWGRPRPPLESGYPLGLESMAGVSPRMGQTSREPGLPHLPLRVLTPGPAGDMICLADQRQNKRSRRLTPISP